VATFRERCGSMTVEIYDLDHGPAHCHISGLPGGLNARVDLYTLEVTKPAGRPLPPRMRRFLRGRRERMLEAWDRVISTDRSEDDGSND
jgi:hypothetical protein